MYRITSFLLLLLVSTPGCVQFDVQKSLSDTNDEILEFTDGKLRLLISEEQKVKARHRTQELLAGELGLSSAIELALQNSPSIQAMLSEYWSDSLDIALSGSVPNPIFEFGRLSSDSELEIERTLSIGLLDLIRLPVLKRKAELKLDMTRLSLTMDVVAHITEVRKAWVNAVAEQQLTIYAERMFSSAEASAKLAIDMQAIGNYNALSRAKQQVYYANAATNLTNSRHAAVAAKEVLIRALGLDAEQAFDLTLPSRLHDLPEEPISAEQVSSAAASNRLDIQMGLAELRTARYADWCIKYWVAGSRKGTKQWN